jgi:hypothetical protein
MPACLTLQFGGRDASLRIRDLRTGYFKDAFESGGHALF